MAAYQVRRLRNDAYQVELYNSGPTIFLYDDTHGEAIKEANPCHPPLHGDGEGGRQAG